MTPPEVPSTAPAPTLHLPAAPEPKPLTGRDPKTGRVLPGNSLNPKGRTPGIPNRNTALQKAFDRFRADKAFADKIARKMGLKVRGKRAEEVALEISLVLAAQGLPGLFEHLSGFTYVKLTPETAGLVLNVNQSQTNVHDERRLSFDELFADAGAREGALAVLQSAAARGLFAGGARDVRQ